MADLLVSEGYAAAGYEYINVDDCWLEKERSYNGDLVPDRTRFPYGMKSLSDYVSIADFYCFEQSVNDWTGSRTNASVIYLFMQHDI